MKLKAVGLREYESVTYFKNGVCWKIQSGHTVELPDDVGYSLLGEERYKKNLVQVKEEKIRSPKNDKMIQDSLVKVQ